MQDFFVEQDNNSTFDIVIDEDKKDFKSTEGLDTAISFQLFVDQRVTQQERANTLDRRGWIGDMQTRAIGYSAGSLLHLQEQARNTFSENNETAEYAKNALKYFVNIRATKEITASLVGSDIQGKIVNNANDSSRYNRLWKAKI